MAHYGMGENCTPVDLAEHMNPKMYMDAWIPDHPVVFSAEDSRTHRIKTISGILSYHKPFGEKKKGIYPADDYLVFPGDQYVGIRIELETDCDDPDDYYDTLSMDDEITIQISNEQDCCEVWGAMLSEDDLSPYIGSKLLEIYFTDTSLNTEHLQLISNYKTCYDYHNVQFINIRTDKGTFQFTVYNCHNGYYGHDVTVVRDGYRDLYRGVI